MQAINELRQLFNQWQYPEGAFLNPTPLLAPLEEPTPRVSIAKRAYTQDPSTITLPMPSTVRPLPLPTPAQRHTAAPREHKSISKGGRAQPNAHQTRSHDFTTAPPPTPAADITQPPNSTVAHCTRSRSSTANHVTPHQTSGHRYPKELILELALWSLPVLYEDTGKILNSFQPHNHLKLPPIWN